MAFNDFKSSTQLKQRFVDILVLIMFQNNFFKVNKVLKYHNLILPKGVCYT